MTTPERTSPTETLARSWAGFALLLLIALVVAAVWLTLSPVSPDPGFAQVRTLIITGAWALTLLWAGLSIWLFRIPPDRLTRPSGWIVGRMQRLSVLMITALLLLEANLLAGLLLENIAPAITNPLRFLLLALSVVALLVMLTAARDQLGAWAQQWRTLWAVLGAGIALVLVVLGLFVLSSRLVTLSGLNDRLRGGLDYRPLVFYDDGEAPAPSQFWAEQARTRVQWLPYTYWTVEPFSGQFITIDSNGLRHTPNTASPDAPTVGFFGGSTVWGEGARDAYTIPGHAARLLAERGEMAYVINYGQTGYVSTQDMLTFQMQLATGSAPDVAVFYGGFNDVYSAYLQGTSGLPLRESQRISDVEAGRLLRDGQPVFRLPDASLDDYDWSLVGGEASAEAIAARWLANRRMIRALAADYGVELLFVWQPSLAYKAELTDSEADIRARLQQDAPGFIALYQAVDEAVTAQLTRENADDVLVLSDLFADDERPIFHDLVHITEVGNLAVAEALLETITSQLAE